MIKNTMLSLFAVLFIQSLVQAQMPSGAEVVARSIEYHDPKGNWALLDLSILRETRFIQDGEERINQMPFRLQPGTGYFGARPTHDDIAYLLAVQADTCYGMVENPLLGAEYELYERFLGCEGAIGMRNFFWYILGLPMKLADPGTIIEEEVQNVRLNEQDYWKVTVNYEPEAGEEVWFFYFDPSTFRLDVAEFYTRGATDGAGERIYFKEYTRLKKVRLPQQLSWHTMPGEEWLADDRYTFKQ